MRTTIAMMLTCGLLVAASLATAQGPGGGPPPADDLVVRMMAFDKDNDGKLTKAEVTDERLHRLFDRADVNKDGSVTKEELTALEAKEKGNDRGPRGFGGPPGGPMMGMMPRPGEILSPMVQQRLRLSSEQEEQLGQLQKEVNARLDKILNDDQRKQLKEMRDRGPGGFGPPGGGPRGGRPGGPPGGPGGGPPPPPDRPE
jgi:hypothetical protein